MCPAQPPRTLLGTMRPNKGFSALPRGEPRPSLAWQKGARHAVSRENLISLLTLLPWAQTSPNQPWKPRRPRNRSPEMTPEENPSPRGTLLHRTLQVAQQEAM